MTHLDELNLLIDKAAAIAGSDYKLAQLIDVSRQNISNWRHGAASCSPENQALLAAVAQLDPVAELARAIVKKHEGTVKGDMLMKALGKASRLTGAVAGFAGAVALAIFSMATPTTSQAAPTVNNTMCIMLNDMEGNPPRRTLSSTPHCSLQLLR